MNPSPNTRLFCGITLLTVPTIEYGGTALLKILSGTSPLVLTEYQQSLFRAGHAHAGVLLILSLICQILIDQARLGKIMEGVLRVGFPLCTVLISGGFFGGGAMAQGRTPGPLIALLTVGMVLLGALLLVLGVALIRNRFSSGEPAAR